ncbi:general transcription factor IIH subunit 2 [Neocloeon triangulifer]|uniref:general transcription factor IIH subunit 2 n=1 Tax=Neocloeon triangulifer TaxID=2078957 RepID=UPI00286F41B3|nr:general transcription factor IIH subunit 2 [Neocloeon triangulifer]
MANEEELKEYRWETGYEKTWEAIKEDDEGLLDASVAEIIQKAKRKRMLEKKNNARLGMMRHLYVIIDMSECMSDQDLKPTRQICTIKLLNAFIEEFFDQNPISQMGIIVMKNKRAEKLSDLTGTAKKHVKALKQLEGMACSGEPSLQNGLEMALRSLKMLPSHASREILVILGSLTTCDPGDINQTINELKENVIQCSLISLAGEVHICRTMAKITGGQFGVVLDDSHFKDLLLLHVEPPPAAAKLEPALIKMGFPHHVTGAVGQSKDAPLLAICMCHLDTPSESKLCAGGYFCPQCNSKYCELPVECKACGLTLASAPHLARSYHHLFPVAPFTELPFHVDDDNSPCYSCQRTYLTSKDKNIYKCSRCLQIFCVDCDIFVHETLHMCPGCASHPSTTSQLK